MDHVFDGIDKFCHFRRRWLSAASLFVYGVSLLTPALSLGYFQTKPASSTKNAPMYRVEVARVFPHDSDAFTQGLAYENGFLFEGTGQLGRSSLRKVDLATGKVLLQVNLAPDEFGEGIAIVDDQIFQLTWQSHIGFVYRLSDFHLLRRFTYSGEGWGLASDGHQLFMSDGTQDIRVLDPATCKEIRRITVREGERPIDQVNELEFVNGQIFANIWHSDRIARISPETGKVLGWINLAGILSPMYRRDPEALLNGIAYDAKGKRLFVTGKLWPSIFEIRLTRAQPTETKSPRVNP